MRKVSNFEKHELVAIYLFFWLSGIAALIYLTTMPLARLTQLIISAVTFSLLYFLYKFSQFKNNRRSSSTIRLLIFLLAALLSFRYLYWRATETLPFNFGIASIFFGLMLFLVECFYFLNSTLGYFISIKPKIRTSIPLPADASALPHVDVYIPTFDESPLIVSPTLIAATQMRYPEEKLHVYLLDDGGTDQKLTNPDKKAAQKAKERSEKLKALAKKFGAIYLTRERNEHAKAGNINHALPQTKSELLLVLDCDHVPTADFLEMTVGFFLPDPKLFLLQTPHNFVNADPVERNLSTYETSPAENELFYGVMQPGMDAWGSTFFCGSAAMLRRSVLDEIGGIAGQTITEDAETTLDALALGYTSAYFNRPLVSGLQPETFAGFLAQRIRWSQGMLQIFLLKKPWKMSGLSMAQRALFTNFSFFWGFSVARLVMLLTAPVFLLFSVILANAQAVDVLIYGLPSLLGSIIISQYLFGRVRWPFISQIYEVIQSVYVTRGVWEVLRNPRAPSFKVTPKGEVLSDDFISGFAKPFYLILFFNVAAIVMGGYRFIIETENRSALLLVGFWAFFDFFLLLCALGITFERKQRRSEPRSLHSEEVVLHLAPNVAIHGTTMDASTSGVKISIPYLPKHMPLLKNKTSVLLEFPKRGIRFQSMLQSISFNDQRYATLGVAYQFFNIADERLAIDIAFGSSEALMENNLRRQSRRGVLSAFYYLGKIALVNGLGHLSFLFLQNLKRFLFREKKLRPR